MDRLNAHELIESWYNGNQTQVTVALVELAQKDTIAGLRVAAVLGNVIGDERITRMLEIVSGRSFIDDVPSNLDPTV
jgi:hypothetical protein